MKRGAGNLDGLLIIAVLIFVFLVTPRGSNVHNTGSGIPIFGGGSISSGTSNGSSQSDVNGRISISSGNASSAYQPYEEYITLENRSGASVDITGWQLRNGKDKRTYDVGGGLQRFSADIAIIPQATRLLSPTGNSLTQDVVLGQGERAIITTGSIGVESPYKITSFKENTCTGYIERLDDYAFSPPLDNSCPQPSAEPGISGLDTQCQNFVKSLSSCTIPKFDRSDQNGETCETCINGSRLSSSCATFIKTHFSYQGCIAYHAGDSNFYNSNTWRVFLGRSWEMWAKDYESIELFDRFNNLVSSRNY